MNKILLYAVALFTAIGCQKLEGNIPSGELISISIQAQLPENGKDTRVSITPDDWDEAWKTAWEKDDKLTLVPTTSGQSLQTLTVESIDESGTATFSGEVLEGVYEVYCIDKYKITADGSLLIDYTEQFYKDKCSNKPMKAIETITVAEGLSTNYTEQYFKHISQTVELRISLDELYAEETYTIKSIEISGAKGDDADYYGFESASVSFEGETVSIDDNSFVVYCYLPEFTIAVGESINLKATLVKNEKEITVEHTITNNTEADVEFLAARHNFLTATFSNIINENWIDYAANQFVEGAYQAGVTSYSIATPEQLAYLAELVVNQGNDMSDVTFTLTSPIDLSSKEWTPIGTYSSDDNSSSKAFCGTFDGKNMLIKGLYINQPTKDAQALFGYVMGDASADAEIKNVSVTGEVIGNGYIGGVIGCVGEYSRIYNCSNSAKVLAESSYAGAIAGYSYSTLIVNCSNNAAVSSKGDYVGGLVGLGAESSNITNSYNSALITGNNYVGGIGGDLNSATNCYNSANVVGSGSNVGAISGSTVTTLTNSYYNSNEYTAESNGTPMTTEEMQDANFMALLNNNAYYYNMDNAPTPKSSAWITSSDAYPMLNTSSEAAYTAVQFEGEGTQSSPYMITSAEDMRQLSLNVNLAGESYSGKYLQMTDNIDLEGIDNDGSVIEANEFTAIGKINIIFGGVFDGNGFEVSGLNVNMGDNINGGLFGYISGATIKNLTVSGSVIGYGRVGGIVGSAASSTVINCHNSAKVSVCGSTGSRSFGGIVGICDGSSVINCYNSGEIYCPNIDEIGGIVGSSFSSSINNCYNTAAVTGTGSEIGGIIGALHSTYTSAVTNCYWLSGVASYGIGTGNSNEGATASNDVYMQSGEFVELLTGNASTYNQSLPTEEACTWSNSSEYPVLNFNSKPIVNPTTFEGEGTEDDPYLISTASYLRLLSTNVNVNKETYEGKYFKMTQNIDLEGIDSDNNGVAENEFTAIGYYNDDKDYTPFNGTFNGGGFEISGLYINQAESNYQGLFGLIRKATIKNLTVSGSVKGNSYVGGIVGATTISYSEFSIIDCYNNADVASLNGTVGGIIGQAASYTIDKSYITNCYNTGAISNKDRNNVGGILGSSYKVIITNCYNSGSVLAAYNNSIYVGGIVGCCSISATSYITNCYNSDAISGKQYVGGIVGGSPKQSAIHINNCYSIGEVSGQNDVGQVVGYCGENSSITNCYFYSDKSGIGSSDDSAIATNVEGRTADEMQNQLFVDTLNENASVYNTSKVETSPSACLWLKSASFPTLKFGEKPTVVD